MKKFSLYSIIGAILMMGTLLVGCGSQKVESPVVGKWAYIHDETTEILNVSANGTAVYKGDKYKVADENGFLILSGTGKDKLKLRYEISGEDLYLYEPAFYTFEGSEDPEGLIGKWSNPTTKWSFEFYDDGTFREDGYFPGYYMLDEATSSFKLAYEDHFEDTTCYYNIEGRELTVEYPWRMIRMK